MTSTEMETTVSVEPEVRQEASPLCEQICNEFIEYVFVAVCVCVCVWFLFADTDLIV
jgi:hypothetical protein